MSVGFRAQRVVRLGTSLRRRARLPAGLLAAACLVLAVPPDGARAQAGGAPPQPAAVAEGGPPEVVAGAGGVKAAPEVRGHWVRRGEKALKGQPIWLADLVELEVHDLEAWLAERQKKCLRDLRMFFGSVEVQGVVAATCKPDAGRVVFAPARIDRRNEAAWHGLVERRKLLHAPVELSVGFAGDEEPVATLLQGDDAPKIYLFFRGRLIFTAVGFVLSLIVFCLLAVKTEMLRDSGPKPETKRRPYSLARVQSAWWFFLLLWAMLLIAAVYGEFPVIPGTLLGLAGISAGTLVGSEAIDCSRRSKAGRDKAATTASLVEDILSDDKGVAFHRFQQVVLALAIGIYFATRVWNDLEMPELDASLVGLMAISSGTYLGVKLPEEGKENKEPPPAEQSKADEAGAPKPVTK